MKEENNLENAQQINMENTRRKEKRKRKKAKTGLLFVLTGITAVVLIVESYAWFIGTGSVKTSEFEIEVSVEKNLFLSLNGSEWLENLTITQDTVVPKAAPTEGGTTQGAHLAYEGNTNSWVGEEGLIPISTDGAIDSNASRLVLYGKSSITATPGGFRLISTRIDNHSTGTGTLTNEKAGYVAFDLFVRNGTGVDYIKEYNVTDDEAIYLTTDSKVEVVMTGDNAPDDDYGLANSVRVAFMQIGRIATQTTDTSKITGLTCVPATTEASDGSGSSGAPSSGTGNVFVGTGPVESTGLCANVVPTIWEPNDTAHDEKLIQYFSNVCKKREVGESGELEYKSDACPSLVDGTRVNTYVVNSDIVSSDAIDVYDGLNGYTVPEGVDQEGKPNYPLTNFATFTDTMKNLENDQRPTFMNLAANSITKIRVYIYLEGQDVDNYDLISKGKKIKVNFGFTKDQFDMLDFDTNGAPSSSSETESSSAE